MMKKSYESIFYNFTRKMIDEENLTDAEIDSILVSNFLFGMVILVEWGMINNFAQSIIKIVTEKDEDVVS